MAMQKILIALLLLLFTLPIFAKNTILIVGDSLSANYGINTQKGWVALLQQRLNEKKYNYHVINASISGDTTSNGLARLSKTLKQNKPQITIIELGGNDGLRGLSISTIKNNLQKMIEMTKATQSKILLLGVRLPSNYGPEYTQQFQQIFLDLSKEEQIPVVPLFLHGIDENVLLMQQDRIHPGIDAQTLMLNNVWPELEKLLAKLSTNR